MKRSKKYWEVVKRKSPKILAIFGSFGTGVTAYLAARNEANYQNKRFNYYLEHGSFPEELENREYTKDELRKKAWGIFGDHLKHHITTGISGGLTIASILCGCVAGEKQNAALAAMNIGIGNMMAKRKDAEDKMIESRQKGSKGPISREDVHDYLIREAYDNDLVFYTTLEGRKDNEEFVWLDIYPGNKIFIVNKADVDGLQWFINTSLKEQNYVSYGEIFDYLNIYGAISPDLVDSDINEWIYMYGFSKRQDDELNIEVCVRPVTVEEGVTVTELSFSAKGNVIEML